MKDWCFNALTGEYKLSDSDHDYEVSLSRLKIPVLSISIEKDNLAPKRAVENLYKKFNGDSPILHLHFTSRNTQISPLNHFSWTRKPDYFVSTILDWTQQLETGL